MPLKNGYSKATVDANIAAEIRAGKSRAQAVAIALDVGRKAWRKKHPRTKYPVHLQNRPTLKKLRKRNPRKSSKKSHLWVVFRIQKSTGFVTFLNIVNGSVFGWGTKGQALLFKEKSRASRTASELGATLKTFDVGIADDNTTVAQIKAACRPKAKSRTGRRKKNPVGPTQKEVDAANDLYRDFRGQHPEKLTKVRMQNPPKVGLVIGELDGVLYTTVRDGKTEHYQHDFRKKSRPLLVTDHDGKALHIHGGEYEFTERGIEDR